MHTKHIVTLPLKDDSRSHFVQILEMIFHVKNLIFGVMKFKLGWVFLYYIEEQSESLSRIFYMCHRKMNSRFRARVSFTEFEIW